MSEPEVALRIVVENPPPGVVFAVQLGKTDLLPPVKHAGPDLVFELRVRVKRGTNGPVFLGPASQGPPHDRFIYVNSGTMAGQAGSCWTRRAKVKLGGIDAQSIERVLAQPGALLEARMAGVGTDGGPTCATVRQPDGVWRVVG